MVTGDLFGSGLEPLAHVSRPLGFPTHFPVVSPGDSCLGNLESLGFVSPAHLIESENTSPGAGAAP